MKISIVTLFPEVFKEYLSTSIVSRAKEKKLLTVEIIQLREFATGKHKKCDDYPFGGGAGLVLKPEPIIACFEKIGVKGKRVIYPSPGGVRYDQQYAKKLASEQDIIILCGHYEGIDQRIIDYYITDEVSIGDYILSGGEVAALVIMDTVIRLREGVINKESHETESFQRNLLEYPQFTRPRQVLGIEVPAVLLTGNHAEIKRWRLLKSIEKTASLRPDLLEKAIEEDEEIKAIYTSLKESEDLKHGFSKSN